MKYIAHHGVKGQKWGVRRYQNKDGSITDLGRKRYSSNTSGETSSDGLSKLEGKLDKVAKAAGASVKTSVNTIRDYKKITTRFHNARLRAKKDPSYKKSEEYMAAKRDFTRLIRVAAMVSSYTTTTATTATANYSY